MARQLYFSKDKINTLIKMENLIMRYSKIIFGLNKDKIIKIKWFDDDVTQISYDDYMKFNNIIEQLITTHKQNIKEQTEYKRKKRKTNNLYGRSKKVMNREGV